MHTVAAIVYDAVNPFELAEAAEIFDGVFYISCSSSIATPSIKKKWRKPHQPLITDEKQEVISDDCPIMERLDNA